jgi:hypothetical protein
MYVYRYEEFSMKDFLLSHQYSELDCVSFYIRIRRMWSLVTISQFDGRQHFWVGLLHNSENHLQFRSTVLIHQSIHCYLYLYADIVLFCVRKISFPPSHDNIAIAAYTATFIAPYTRKSPMQMTRLFMHGRGYHEHTLAAQFDWLDNIIILYSHPFEIHSKLISMNWWICINSSKQFQRQSWPTSGANIIALL